MIFCKTIANSAYIASISLVLLAEAQNNLVIIMDEIDEVPPPASFEPTDCIWLDTFGVSGLMLFPPSVGGWVSDGEILLQDWEHGMDMRALNYCINRTTGHFISMQVILGHDDIEGDEELHLQKHGGEGGECHRWVLNDHDFITKVKYTYDWWDGFVTKVEFTTNQQQYRSIGKGDGPFVRYHYNNEKQFVGFLSYEIDDETFAFGAYDSVCNHLGKDDSGEIVPLDNKSELDEQVEAYLKSHDEEVTEEKVNELKEKVIGPKDESAPEKPAW